MPSWLSYGRPARFDTGACNYGIRRFVTARTKVVGGMRIKIAGEPATEAVDRTVGKKAESGRDKYKRAARPMGGRLACNQEIGVRLPGGPLNSEGSRIRLAGPHC